jgi:hypothetical protein
VLERSNTLSQRALKHTEHFVEEVVNVNDKLVNSLATSRKFRRLQSADKQRRSLSYNSMAVLASQ